MAAVHSASVFGAGGRCAFSDQYLRWQSSPHALTVTVVPGASFLMPLKIVRGAGTTACRVNR